MGSLKIFGIIKMCNTIDITNIVSISIFKKLKLYIALPFRHKKTKPSKIQVIKKKYTYLTKSNLLCIGVYLLRKMTKGELKQLL